MNRFELNEDLTPAWRPAFFFARETIEKSTRTSVSSAHALSVIASQSLRDATSPVWQRGRTKGKGILFNLVQPKRRVVTGFD